MIVFILVALISLVSGVVVWAVLDHRQQQRTSSRRVRIEPERRREILENFASVQRAAGGLREGFAALESYGARYNITLPPEERNNIIAKQESIEEALRQAERLIRTNEWDYAESLLSYLLTPRVEPEGSLAAFTEERLSFKLVELKDWDTSVYGTLGELSAALRAAAAEGQIPVLTSNPTRKPTVVVAGELEEEFKSGVPKTPWRDTRE